LLKLRASGWCCLAGKASIFRYVSPRAMASASPGQASRTILQSRRASTRSLPLLGQNGEVAQDQMASNALVDAAKLVGTLQGQDPPPAGFGLGRLAGLAVEDGLAEEQLGGVGVVP